MKIVTESIRRTNGQANDDKSKVANRQINNGCQNWHRVDLDLWRAVVFSICDSISSNIGWAKSRAGRRGVRRCSDLVVDRCGISRTAHRRTNIVLVW